MRLSASLVLFGASGVSCVPIWPGSLGNRIDATKSGAGKGYNRDNMPRNFLVLSLLLAAGAAGQDKPAPKRGEVDFELTSLGRNPSGSTITAAVKVTNKSTSNVVYLLLTSPPSAVDSDGGTFSNAQVTGVAYCSRISKDSAWFVPLETYTEIGPEQSAVFTVVLKAAPSNSKGEKITLSGQFAYRVIKEANRDTDASLPLPQKLKTVRFGSMTFNGPPEAHGYAVTKITYAEI